MMSGKLFARILKTDFKQRAWSLLLGFIVFFLCLPAAYLLMLGSQIGTDPIRAMRTAEELFRSSGSLMLPFVTVAAACICAPGGFTYLHKRSGTDYYHSLPVRRETLFAAKYVNGILIYLLSFGINLLFTLLLAAAGGGVTGEVLRSAACMFAGHMTAYLMLYSIALAATFLTGNLPVNILMIGFLYLYGIFVRFLRVCLMDSFLCTYVHSSWLEDTGTILSPLSFYTGLTVYGEGWPVHVLIGLLIAAGFSALALLLYRVRPSEASDRALAFPWMRLPLKFLVCVPAGLMGGWFFYSMRMSMGWYLFGIVVLWLISSVFMEMVTALSFRQGFAHWKSSALCLAVSGFILLVFVQDLTGYDAYLPRKDSLAYMAVNVSMLDTEQDAYSWGEDGLPYYESMNSYRMNHMRLTNLDAAYDLAAESIQTLEAYNNEQQMDGSWITVCFSTKSGRKIYRQYPQCNEEQVRLLAQVYDSEEYKEGSFSILTDEEHLEYYKGIHYRDFLGQEYEQTLSAQDMESIYNAFTADLRDASLADSFTQEIGILSFRIERDSWYGDYDSTLGSYPVYAGYKRTPAVLYSLGIRADYNPSSVEVVDVDVYDDDYSGQVTTYTYTDPEEIRQILPCLRSRRADWYYDTDSLYVSGVEARVTLAGAQNEYDYQNYDLALSELPDFLREDLGLDQAP